MHFFIHVKHMVAGLGRNEVLLLCYSSVDEIVEDADKKLFNNIIYNKLHVFPDTKDTKYHLRPRTHNLKLTVKNSSISQSDFITRMLFKDVY